MDLGHLRYLCLNTLTANILLPVLVCHTSYSAFAGLHAQSDECTRTRVCSTLPGSKSEKSQGPSAHPSHFTAHGAHSSPRELSSRARHRFRGRKRWMSPGAARLCDACVRPLACFRRHPNTPVFVSHELCTACKRTLHTCLMLPPLLLLVVAVAVAVWDGARGPHA